jgi:hypothetical protein
MPVYKKNSFRVDGWAVHCGSFVPRPFDFCPSLGMNTNCIMPSPAFFSDGELGYLVMPVAEHFGTFPYHHGRVGGIVITERRQPYARHGRHSVDIQASHRGSFIQLEFRKTKRGSGYEQRSRFRSAEER